MALTIPVSEIVEKSKNLLLSKHQSWKRVSLGEIAKVQNGYAFNSNQFSKDDGIPLIRIRDINKETTEIMYSGDYDPTYIVGPGDLLVGMDGDFNCARWKGPRGLLNQRVCKITLSSDIYHPKFLEYTLPGFLKAINDVTSSVTVKHISSRTIEEIPLPFPLLGEQSLIVTEIEKQFSRLDEAVASLKRVKANLKRYKASVLKAAVEGKLTEQWRKEHPDVEPAEKLLEKILTERRKKWEECELAKMKAKNIKPKDDKWKKNYKEPVAADLYELFKLPEGWIVSTLDTFCHHIGDVDHKMPKAQEHGIPYISTRDFLPNGEIDYSNAKKIRVEDYKRSCQKICPDIGDILMSRYGTIGEVRLVKSTEAFQASYSIAIIKPALKEMNNYLALVLQADILQKQIQKYTRATAQPDLGLAHIRQLAIPLPPKIEQEVLIKEVEKRFSIMVEIEKQIDLNMRRAEHLRQSILKKAFSGKLVPQDVSDSTSDT